MWEPDRVSVRLDDFPRRPKRGVVDIPEHTVRVVGICRIDYPLVLRARCSVSAAVPGSETCQREGTHGDLEADLRQVFCGLVRLAWRGDDDRYRCGGIEEVEEVLAQHGEDVLLRHGAVPLEQLAVEVLVHPAEGLVQEGCKGL